MPGRLSEEKQLEWKSIVERQKQSGLPIEKWCLQNHVLVHRFYYWKDKLFPKTFQKANFTELNIKRPRAVSLQAPGLHIRIDSSCDLNVRRQLFAIFAEASC